MAKKKVLDVVAEIVALKENIPRDKAKEKLQATILKIDNYQDNARAFYDINPFFYDKIGLFWIWEDYRYILTDETELGRKLDDMLGFAGQTISSGIRNNHLTALKWIGRENIPKDAPVSWLQFKGLVFDIETKKEFPATKEYFFTNPIPWELTKNDDTPTIDKLFTEWVGNDWKQTLYEIIAYCCYRKMPMHIIVVLFGAGLNGKGQFQQMLAKFLGSHNVCTTDLELLTHNRFETFKLYKKLACQMGETNFGILEQTSLIKRASGEDLLGFEAKGKQGFDDYSYCKLLINSNSLPVTLDTSLGFWRRWLIVHFSRQFKEGKDIVITVSNKEYSALCRKVCDILPGLLEAGTFTNQGTIEERRLRYIEASNPLELFVQKFCEIGDEFVTSYNKMFNAYTSFLKSKNRREVSKKTFSAAIQALGYDIDKTSRKDDDGKVINGFFIFGIKPKVTDVTDVTTISLLSLYSKGSENMVTTVTTVTKEHLLPIIRLKPGINTDAISKEIKVTVGEIYPILKQMKKDNEIFELPADCWHILE